MDRAARGKFEQLLTDYHRVAGAPCKYFFCPILYKDEEVPLCRGHIINDAFPNAPSAWTIQRQDVDNFYGWVFEADFVGIQYRGAWTPEEVFGDKDRYRHLNPTILLDGAPVEHYIPTSPIPEHFSELTLRGPRHEVRLGIKMHPTDLLNNSGKQWEIQIAKDMRVAALASLIKAAHLTLFDMLGYRYALSAAGHFMGKTILGDFFLAHHAARKAAILVSAPAHFCEFINMVRPVVSDAPRLAGTVVDHTLFLCQNGAAPPWAFMVFIHTGHSLHAVLVPIFEEHSAIDRFLRFLRAESGTIVARRCEFKSNQWLVGTDSVTLDWPKAILH